MLKFLKQKKFPTIPFMVASLATFILLGLFIIIINSLLLPYSQEPVTKAQSSSHDKYYLNNNYSEGDELITKVPSLKDMLAGPIISNIDPSLGPLDAPITIVYFADFECSFCQKQEQVLKQIMDQYNSKVRLIWKDYPRYNPDSASYQAAIAARCAQEQNKFWPYHDLLYQNNQNLEQDKFLNLATELNLNSSQFERCLKSAAIQGLINDNITEANALDINGIPFIYINDQEVMGQITIEELKRIVDIELGEMQNAK